MPTGSHLQGYTYRIKGDHSISDYFISRHPSKPLETHNLEIYINFVADYTCPNALRLKDIKKETWKDHTPEVV